jgi:hypothetical protein
VESHKRVTRIAWTKKRITRVLHIVTRELSLALLLVYELPRSYLIQQHFHRKPQWQSLSTPITAGL